MDRVFWKMVANRHPGLIPNTIANALVSHYDYIQVPLRVPLILPIPLLSLV